MKEFSSANLMPYPRRHAPENMHLPFCLFVYSRLSKTQSLQAALEKCKAETELPRKVVHARNSKAIGIFPLAGLFGVFGRSWISAMLAFG